MGKKRSKKYLNAIGQIDNGISHPVKNAVELCQKVAFAKFDESVELSFNLGVDPRHADQMVRGALMLPAGTGKTTRVLVIASGEKLLEAEKAGADMVGGDDIVAKIAGGWLDFDKVIATPDMMGKIGRIGKILGPRGLMPNPKLGTVTMDVKKAVTEQKAGKLEYRTDKNGIIHLAVGKKSFSVEKLLENIDAAVSTILRAKPTSSKGTYLKSLFMSTTMGPGVRVDILDATNRV